MRLRTLVVTAAIALGVVAPATAASAAQVCYDAEVVVNGTAVVDEADCIEA